MKLNSKWSIEVEANGGVKLIFGEKRDRKKIGKDKKPTGETEEYLFEDVWYYNNIQSALRAYLLKSLEDSKDVKDCLNKIDLAMEEITKTFINLHK